jgi:hypothetical protein
VLSVIAGTKGVGIVPIEQVATVVLALVVGIAAGSWLQRDRSSVRAVEQRLSGLATQIDCWQRTHEVHQNELDRRLARVEEAAARAENETRMLSGLLSAEDDDVSRPHVYTSSLTHPRRAG